MANLGTVNAETMVFFRVLYRAPGHRLTREQVVNEVAAVVYPSRGFQSEMDRKRREVPSYLEPKQGTKAWQRLLDAGRQRIAADFVREKTRVKKHGSGKGHVTPQFTMIEVEGDVEWIVLTPDGIERAESLGQLPADAMERMKLERAKKFQPPLDLTTLLRPLTETEYNELRASMQQFGQMAAIVKDEGGLTIDGRNRERVCHELGLTPVIKVVPWDTPGDDKVAMCLQLNVARRQVSLEERSHIMLTMWDAGMTQQRIAKAWGVEQPAVAKALQGLGAKRRARGQTSNGRTLYTEDTKEEVRRLLDTGLSQRQVATQLDIPVGTVKTFVHRPVVSDIPQEYVKLPEPEPEQEPEPPPTPLMRKQSRKVVQEEAEPESVSEMCSGCHGHGQVLRPCDRCGGSGRVTSLHLVTH